MQSDEIIGRKMMQVEPFASNDWLCDVRQFHMLMVISHLVSEGGG
jgi:hypothetical protein